MLNRAVRDAVGAGDCKVAGGEANTASDDSRARVESGEVDIITSI